MTDVPKSATCSATDMIAPGGTIGILGGGQLGRMIALAAAKLGYKCHIYCPEENSPAFQVANAYTVAAYDDETRLALFAKAVDVVTYEFENVPAQTAKIVAQYAPLRPGARALEVSQDRLSEKTFLNQHHITTAPFAPFATLDELRSAVQKIGKPAVAKTRRMGYDGKGQALIKNRENIDDVMDVTKGADAILEGFVTFDREISAIVARAKSGDVAAFPIAENVHTNHILATTTVPANVKTIVEAKAKIMATKIANALDYIGVLTVEMFISDATGTVTVNELAPRVHNSGHWTIEGAETSQFEQHVRAICGLPLGPTDALGTITMKNLLGSDILDFEKYFNDPKVHYHHYGKKHPRKGRKMGHVTWVETAK